MQCEAGQREKGSGETSPSGRNTASSLPSRGEDAVIQIGRLCEEGREAAR